MNSPSSFPVPNSTDDQLENATLATHDWLLPLETEEDDRIKIVPRDQPITAGSPATPGSRLPDLIFSSENAKPAPGECRGD